MRYIIYLMAKKLVTAFLILVFLGGLGVGGWLYLKGKGEPSPIPAAVRQQVDFPLYYPSRLPDGYAVSQTPTVSESVVVMAVKTPSGNNVFISQQAAPTGLDYQKFLNDELKRPREYSTPAGVAYIGGPVGRMLGSILTSKTWILLNASLSGNTENETKKVMASLELVK